MKKFAPPQKKGGMLTWPIQDDWMNTTKNFEHDPKNLHPRTLTFELDQK